MPAKLEQLDGAMEKASRALAEMDYLACESLCLEALAEARAGGRWSYYARVLMPLQEARRQRRMNALVGDIQLGSDESGFNPQAWLMERQAGCLALTHPHTTADALTLQETARRKRKFVEVLFADNARSDSAWTLRSFDGPPVACTVPAPTNDSDPARWFINATEQLGDAALAGVDESLTGIQRINELETRLRVFTDHELLHQHLADAARAVRRA